jgi:hypothetical protein
LFIKDFRPLSENLPGFNKVLKNRSQKTYTYISGVEMPRGKSSNNADTDDNEATPVNPLRLRLNLKKKEPSPPKEPPIKNLTKFTTHSSDRNIAENAGQTIKSPKITLSVRKLRPPSPAQAQERDEENKENFRPENNNSFQQPAIKRRGRPPKYPSPMAPLVPKGTSAQRDQGTAAGRLMSINPTFPPLRAPLASLPLSSSAPPMMSSSAVSSSLTLREQERFKSLQNALPLHLSSEYERLFKVDYNRPFESSADAYERLLPFHIISHADYQMPTLLDKVGDVDGAIEQLQRRYGVYCRTDRELKIPMEIQLLENRLNLEEERFLLQKLKTECIAKYDKIPL